jgi:hypothetical protein
MLPWRQVLRLPRFAMAYAAILLGAYGWWAMQSPHTRLAVLMGSSTDIAHLERAPWLVLPLSSIWSGDFAGYWVVLVLLCVGALERLRGALTTVLVGVLAHVVGTLVSEGVTAIRIAAGDLSSSARHLVDVGPSYAVAACAAAVVATRTAPRWLRIACALTLVPLAVAAFDDLSDAGQVAAIGHAVSVLIGFVVGRWRHPRMEPARLTPCEA